MTPADFKAARKSLGLTQQQWADWLGLHRVTIGNIETGKSPITPTVALLVDAIRQGYRPEGSRRGGSSARAGA